MWAAIASILEWLADFWFEKKPQPRMKDAPLTDAEEISDFDKLP